MKRRIFKLGLFLLLAAIINVAVAWGCCLWPSWQDWPVDAETTLSLWRSSFPDCHVVIVDKALGFDDLERLVAWAAMRSRGCQIICVATSCRCHPDVSTIADLRCGAPALSLRGVEVQFGRLGGMSYSQSRGEIDLRNTFLSNYASADSLKALAWQPLWPGFAINTIFYAAIVWMLYAAPVKLHHVARRNRRIKRGQCPACAYPVGASDVCTECGKPVTPKSVEPVT